ncbi:hypothetical protein, variant 1 [Aphanomyces astaci]|uniref:Uncharacterized protein n=1 Tax=Aphanomyces astaci TaxID=112090 RepID=W4GSV6_APHAT|nr:hypothetical protein, variant 1 [Aphanomyces astaci]ETV82792.1 hypothetical protein, variant 1 [Aphanomyces astaci]|eukprot:XP_009827466.1 hypothetical protein, variant 1 [Aphanomyces astaci]
MTSPHSTSSLCVTTAASYPQPRWVERGASFLRRINLERVAEDPRVKLLITGQHPTESGLLSPHSLHPLNDELQQPAMPSPSPPRHGVGGPTSWPRSLKESIQNTFFNKNHEEPLLHLSPRMAVLGPHFMHTILKLFAAKTSSTTWSDAQQAMATLDTAIAARFADKACVLDCGLFDAIQKTHQKPLVQDTFAGGRVTSLPFKRGAVPSMHAMFVATSTVSAWLALHESHVVIILAPNLEQMSLYLACAALYRAPFSSDLMPYGERILQWLAENVDASESLAARLSKTFADSETRNTTYIPGLPRPQVRFLQDFAALLILRDKQLMASMLTPDTPPSNTTRPTLSGAAVLPALHPLYIHKLVLLPSPNANNRYLPDNCYRPYFVLQDEQGHVLYSSMVLGIRSILTVDGPHAFKVGRQVHTGDLHLHMYHVPVNSRGQIVLESRLNCSLLFEHLRMDDRGEITLRMKDGDFDCVSTLYTPHVDFALQVVYGINAEAFAAEDEADAAAALADAPTRAGRAPSNPNLVLAIPRANLRRQLVPEEAMIVSSVTVADAIVYSSVGDVHLKQVDVCQRSGVVYLQFHVQCGDGQLRVLTTNQLFGYSLPAAVLTTLTEVGALELVAQMPQFDPSNSADSFDEQYGLWLQRQFDDDISRLSTQIRIGTTPTDIENLVAQHGELGLVMLANQLQQAELNNTYEKALYFYIPYPS